MKRTALISFALAAGVVLGAEEEKFAADFTTPYVCAPYATVKPEIDGNITDAEWGRAVYLNALRNKDTKAMSYRGTAFWIQWDEDNVYVAMRSPLRKGERLMRNLRDTERDVNSVFDDAFEVFLNANNNSPDGQPVFFQYLANFDNATYDAMHEPRVGNRRESWRSNWVVKSGFSKDAKAGVDCWDMEMRIPRETIYRDPFKVGEVVSMLIARDFKNPWEQNSFEGSSDFSVPEKHTHIQLVKDEPVVRFFSPCDAVKGTFGLDLEVVGGAKDADVEWSFLASDGTEKKGKAKVPAGKVVKPSGLALNWLQGDKDKYCRIMVKSGNKVLLDWFTRAAFVGESCLTLAKPSPDDVMRLSCAFNPVRNYVRVSADYVDFKAVDKVTQATAAVTDSKGKEIAKQVLPMDDRLYTRGFVHLGDLKNDTYTITVTAQDKDGKALRSESKTFEKADEKTRWPFYGTKCGNYEKVLEPWSAVKNSGEKVSVWGRDMTIGDAGLPSSFVSQGHELFRSPASLVICDADYACSKAAKKSVKKVFDKDYRKSFESVSGMGDFTVKTLTEVEYDGMYKVTMTIEPPKEGKKVLEMKMTLPLNGARARYVYGKGAEIRSGFDMSWLKEKGDKDGVIWTSKRVDSNPMWVGDFIPYVWFGDNKAGICWFADTDKGWVPNDDVPAIQVFRNGKDVDVIFNFISSVTDFNEPRTIVFAFEGSPVKPFAADGRTEQWWCGHTFLKGWGSWVYPETGGDMIWQSRVNTVDPVKCRKHSLEEKSVGRLAVPYFEYNTMENVTQKTLPDVAPGIEYKETRANPQAIQKNLERKEKAAADAANRLKGAQDALKKAEAELAGVVAKGEKAIAEAKDDKAKAAAEKNLAGLRGRSEQNVARAKGSLAKAEQAKADADAAAKAAKANLDADIKADVEAATAATKAAHDEARAKVTTFPKRDKPLNLSGAKEYFGDAWKIDSGNILCYCDSFQDFVIWNLDDWLKTSDIDGWYLDNVRPCYSANIEDGYGYRLPDGRIQPEYNMFQMRKFFLRLRAVFQENGKKRSHIVNHMTNNMIIPWNGACDVAYDGEANVIFFGTKKDGKHQTDFMDVWTEERLFTAFPGMWGININFMHEYQGDWQREIGQDGLDKCFRAYEAAVMLYDALPTGNHNNELVSFDFWRARTDFGIDDPSVRFVPYWDGEELGLVSKTKGVKASAWVKEGKGEALVIVTNWNGDDKPVNAKIEIDIKKLGLPADAVAKDALWEAGRALKQRNLPEVPTTFEYKKGTLKVEINRHDYRLIRISADKTE